MIGLVIVAIGMLALPLLLPIAGVSINMGLLASVGVVIGFLSGLLGVGGGFLMTPILMMIGIPPIVAAASDTNAIIATSASGVAAHFRLNNVDFKMGGTCLLGGLFGSAIGVQAVKILRARGNADLLISVMYIVVLGGLGSFMVYNSIAKLRRGVMAPRMRKAGSNAFTSFLARLPFQTDFTRSGVRHSVLLPFFLCSLVGIMTALMGVGGGFIMVPAMVYLLRMPAHVAVGTDLFQILFTCMGVTLMQAASNHSVDLVLALLIAAGSTIGAQIGARVSRHMRGEQLLIVLGVLALAVGLKMAVGIVVPPSNPLSGAGGHALLKPIDHNATLARVQDFVRSSLWH
ncbi:MAG: sulfite exporter TauE/SafE family protein [Candidatus Korobacteraceae bacterium]|jgi:uncharacterized membrane protein YfcA